MAKKTGGWLNASASRRKSGTIHHSSASPAVLYPRGGGSSSRGDRPYGNNEGEEMSGAFGSAYARPRFRDLTRPYSTYNRGRLYVHCPICRREFETGQTETNKHLATTKAAVRQAYALATSHIRRDHP